MESIEDLFNCLFNDGDLNIDLIPINYFSESKYLAFGNSEQVELDYEDFEGSVVEFINTVFNLLREGFSVTVVKMEDLNLVHFIDSLYTFIMVNFYTTSEDTVDGWHPLGMLSFELKYCEDLVELIQDNGFLASFISRCRQLIQSYSFRMDLRDRSLDLDRCFCLFKPKASEIRLELSSDNNSVDKFKYLIGESDAECISTQSLLNYDVYMGGQIGLYQVFKAGHKVGLVDFSKLLTKLNAEFLTNQSDLLDSVERVSLFLVKFLLFL